jgi:hypothetical protein
VLTIAAATTVNLAGAAAAVGQLILTGAASNPAEVKLVDAATSIIKTGNTAGASAFTTAAKIGGKTFATGSNAAIYTTGNAVAGKLAKILGGTANYGLKGGDADNTIVIDGSQDVAAT